MKESCAAMPSAISLTVALAAYLLQTTSSAPSMSAPTATMGSNPQCVEYTHPYCKRFNYTHAMFPNPRQRDLQLFSPRLLLPKDYENNAWSEFSHFFSLLDTECSAKLGTLLCFFYFPLCNPLKDPLKGDTVYPCRSLCEEVTKTGGECDRQLANISAQEGSTTILSWKETLHFNCSHYTYRSKLVYKENFCANNTQVKWDKCADFPGNKNCASATTKNAPTTDSPVTITKKQTIREITTQAAPAPVCDLCPDSYQCPPKCKNRKQLGSRSFERNGYNFAVRATFNSLTTYDCRRALSFTVVEQFPIKSKGNCTLAPTVAENSILIAVGDASTCLDCFTDAELGHELTVGSEYVLAGYHKPAPAGCEDDTLWWVTDNSAIAPWNVKRKKFAKFVKKGNTARSC